MEDEKIRAMSEIANGLKTMTVADGIAKSGGTLEEAGRMICSQEDAKEDESKTNRASAWYKSWNP